MKNLIENEIESVRAVYVHEGSVWDSVRREAISWRYDHMFIRYQYLRVLKMISAFIYVVLKEDVVIK